MWISEISIDKKYENEFGYLANGLKDIKNLSFTKEAAKRRYIFSVAAADEYELDVKEDILRLVKNVILIFIKRRILFEGLSFDANTYVKITALASITHFDSYYEEKYLEYQLKDMVDYNVDAIFNFRLQKLKSNWQELRSLTESLLYYADNEDLTYIASFMNSTSKERVDKLTVSGGNGEAVLAIYGSDRKVEVLPIYSNFYYNLLDAIILANPKTLVVKNLKLPEEMTEILEKITLVKR